MCQPAFRQGCRSRAHRRASYRMGGDFQLHPSCLEDDQFPYEHSSMCKRIAVALGMV